MVKGTVKSFSDIRGFGFIVLDNGHDVLVDYSAIAGRFKSLNEGDKVSLDIVTGPRGPAAANVVKG
jgi:CspA family cold shock protein